MTTIYKTVDWAKLSFMLKVGGEGGGGTKRFGVVFSWNFVISHGILPFLSPIFFF